MSEKVRSFDKGPGFGIRHIQVFLIFALLSIAMGMRVTLSVAIVAMTDNTTSSNPDIPTYDWDNKSVVLSSFYWGYILLQVVAGDMGRTYSTKKILIVTMFFNSLAFMLIPLMADTLGSYGVMGCRVVQGIFQGFLQPSIYNILAKWVPVSERSMLNTIAQSGVPLGSILAMPLTGFISSSWIGWPWAFYLYGIIGFLWIISWYFLAADTPAEHSSITDVERNFIEKSLIGTDKQEKKIETPWKALLTSKATWAYIVTSVLQNWGTTIIATEIPDYLSEVMKFDINQNGILSAAPNFVSFLLGLVFAQISDYVENRQYVSRDLSRKIFTTISNLGPAVAFIALSFLTEDAKVLSVSMLIVFSSLNSAVTSGVSISPFDIAPNFAGILKAFGNSLSTVASILAPLVVQFVVTDEADKSQWGIIFMISVLAYFASTIIFLVFSSSEVQPWNNSEAKLDKEIEKKLSKTEDFMKP